MNAADKQQAIAIQAAFWPRLSSILLLLGIVAAFYRVAVHPPPADFAVAAAAEPSAAHPGAEPVAVFVSSVDNPRVHAATLVEDGRGRIHAFWYSGSREGAGDVQIRGAVFDPQRGDWTPERIIVTREQTARALRRYIKKLGNPAAVRAADGRLLLFFVSVSVGGWSGSSISVTESYDDGESWQAPRRLITSPFFNLSTLVRGSPFLYADGGIGVPVYHELIAKFGEIIRLSPADSFASVVDKQRLSAAPAAALQPEVIIENARRASVFMRQAGDAPRHVLTTASEDAGRNWTAVHSTAFPNPDAAVAALALHDGTWLLVLNDQAEDRSKLALYASRDRGKTWRFMHRLEDLSRQSAARVGGKRRVSYPDLLQAQNGEVHLVYTYKHAFIKHIRFDPAWLRRARDEAS